MNLQFSGVSKACWLGGLVLIMVSALISLSSGSNAAAPLVALGALLIGLAFLLRKKTNG